MTLEGMAITAVILGIPIDSFDYYYKK